VWLSLIITPFPVEKAVSSCNEEHRRNRLKLGNVSEQRLYMLFAGSIHAGGSFDSAQRVRA
jgi:hypothetical protein